MTLTEDIENDLFVADILSKSKTIAMVGASQNWKRPSNFVMKYLQKHGYKIIPVNPRNAGESILGEKVFGNIKEIDGPIEIVDVFRPSNEAAEIAKDAIKVKAKVLWLQLDIRNEEAKKIVETNDIIYIENKCTKIEYEKYFN